MRTGVEFVVRTAPPDGGSGAGAIGVIDLLGEDEQGLTSALARIAPPGARAGEARVRRVGGTETVVLARWSATCASLTPHAGSAALRRALEALERAGVARAPGEAFDARRWPEARDAVEARALAALARAPSPRAIDLLLDQPRRWRARAEVGASSEEIGRHSRALNRLLRPPVVAALGVSNIGKSALLNALAGRAVAVVADEPGTTRDHIGATLELDGLVVRWLDTPGLRETDDAVERAARAACAPVIAGADLVISCADGASGFLADRELRALGAVAPGEALRVGVRADLARAPGAEVSTSALTGEGLAALASAVRERLVPGASLAWPGPWRFDEALPM